MFSDLEEPTGIACAKEDASEKPKESEAKEHVSITVYYFFFYNRI